MILILVLVLLCGVAPFLIRKVRHQRRQELLCRQLTQTLLQMTHALRIGVGMQQAFEYAAREGEKPLATEWQRLLHRIQLGTSWTEALAELPARVQIDEMKWFVVAVEITRKTGGALADVLENLAVTLQDRQTLRDKVRALTAQGKASGGVLAALPFVLLAALRLLVPELVRPMFTTFAGHCLLAGMIVSVSIGGLVIWKIVHIRVDA